MGVLIAHAKKHYFYFEGFKSLPTSEQPIPAAKNLPYKTCMKELQNQTKMALEARFVSYLSLYILCSLKHYALKRHNAFSMNK